MNPLLHKFHEDLTGTSQNNRVRSELHDMGRIYDLDYRCVVLDYGYFFVDNLYILDELGKELREGIDYQLIGFNEDIAALTGRTACSVVVILNRKVAPRIYVDANMVGGQYEKVGPAIARMANGLLNNTRPTQWNYIDGKPDSFAPGGHMHPLWELYGFTPSVALFKRMAVGLGKKADKILEAIYQQFDAKMKQVELEQEAVNALLTTHMADFNNPHKDTAGKIQMGNVTNRSTATATQARQTHGNLMDIYATPWSVGLAMAANFTPIMNSHVQDMNNPHGLTAAQLNVYTVTEFNNKARLYVDLNATMDKTTLIYSITPEALRPIMVNNNNVVNLTSNMYPFARWAKPYLTNTPVTNQVMQGDGGWQNLDALITREVKQSTQVYYITSNTGRLGAVPAANASYPSAPIGSILFYHYDRTGVSYNGNGAIVYNYTRSTMMLAKNPEGWTVSRGNP